MSKSGHILKFVLAAIMMIVVALGLCLDGCSNIGTEGEASRTYGNNDDEKGQYVELCADTPFEGIAAESVSIPAPTASSTERNRIQWRYTHSRSLAYVQNHDTLSRLSAEYITLSTSEAIALCYSTRSCDYYVYAERKILI